MPTFTILATTSVSAPKGSADRADLLPYESFVKEVGEMSVGELLLSPSDDIGAVKLLVRRAAERVGLELHIWEVSGNVYFRSPGAKKGRISRLA